MGERLHLCRGRPVETVAIWRYLEQAELWDSAYYLHSEVERQG